MKALMFSAEFVDIEEEEETESKFDKWLDDKFGDKIKDIVIYVSIAISLVFSIALFMVLPTFLTKGAEKIGTLIPPISAFTDSHLFTSLFEGIKMCIRDSGWGGEGIQLVHNHLELLKLKPFEKPFGCMNRIQSKAYSSY